MVLSALSLPAAPVTRLPRSLPLRPQGDMFCLPHGPSSLQNPSDAPFQSQPSCHPPQGQGPIPPPPFQARATWPPWGHNELRGK